MNFNEPDLAAALAEGLAQTDVSVSAKAQNIAWEECVSDARLHFFETDGFNGRGTSWRELADRQSEYIGLYVNSFGMPHTFDPGLDPARIGPLDEDQWVVRLERLERGLDNSIYTFEELSTAHAERDLVALDRFADDWNAVRDARPAFSTFLREVQDEISRPDWPELLRDRLGLAQHQPTGKPIPVALMAYSVREVLAEAGSGIPFTIPTVLDSVLWEHYFPAPKEIPFGRAMALTPCESDENLVAEILHSRVSYKGRHISALGKIVTPLPALPVATLREQHLLALQIASGRDNFGA